MALLLIDVSIVLPKIDIIKIVGYILMPILSEKLLKGSETAKENEFAI